MEKSKNEVQEKFNRPNLESPMSLIKKSWQLFSQEFLDYVEMYIWGLVGAIPLLALFLVLVILNIVLDNLLLENLTLKILSFSAIAATILWALYYGVRAHIGVLLLIIKPEKKVKKAFIESNKFFYDYVIINIFSSILLTLLFIAFIIPGVIFSIYWVFATILVVVEGIKNTETALKRSKSLVKGYWWPVLGRMLFIGVIYMLVVSVIALPGEILNGTWAFIYSSVMNIIATLLTPLLLIYTYYLYLDLRQKK